MARARNIKPGFFTNEDLVELDFATRLLFIGLWTEADREGRLEDRPKRLKMALFPADSLDVDAMLGELARMGFIRRYVAGGVKVIQVVNWGKHQNPHHTEKASVLPAEDAPATSGEASTPDLSGDNGDLTVNSPLEHGECPADSLIPDSTPSHTREGAREAPALAVPARPVEPLPTAGPHPMTLEWEPDQRRLKALAVRAGLPLALFAQEAIAGFVIHHEAKGLIRTSSEWHAALVNWVKRDAEQARSQAGRVVSFPAQRRANGPNFDDTSWADDLGDL